MIVKLKDISIGGKGEYGIGASAVDFDESLPTYLRITDINDDGTLDKTNLKSVNHSDSKFYVLKENDIVFARTGASTGRNYFYSKKDGDFVYAGFLIKFSIDNSKVNPKYIKYYAQSKPYKDWIVSFNTGSTRGNINAQTLGNMEISLPSPEQQDLLVDVLSALDDKIELNNRINKNLEEQAQALFKHWFVDFEFPDSNGNPYKSSGGKMTDSELGEIPEGWKIKDIYHFSEIIYGAPFASKFFNQENKGKPIIRIRDLPSQKSDVFTDEIHPKGYLLQKGDIAVGMDGEFRAYIWSGVESWLNQRLCVFKEKGNVSKAFIYFSLIPLLHKVEKTEVATTVIHIGKNDFDKFYIANPKQEIMLKYKVIADKLIQQIVINNQENQKLAQLRDYLLPKLMSGEITVNFKELQ